MKTTKEIQEMGISVIAINLYLLNKEAKQAEKSKNEKEKIDHILYELKNETIEILKKRKIAKLIGYHKVGERNKYNSYMGYTQSHPINANCYIITDENGKDWSFHIRSNRAAGVYLGDLTGKFSSEKIIEGNSNLNLLEKITEYPAQKNIKEYIERIDNQREEEIKRKIEIEKKTEKNQKLAERIGEIIKGFGSVYVVRNGDIDVHMGSDILSNPSISEIQERIKVLKKAKAEREKETNKRENAINSITEEITKRAKTEKKMSTFRRLMSAVDYINNRYDTPLIDPIIEKAFALPKEKLAEIITSAGARYARRERRIREGINATQL